MQKELLPSLSVIVPTYREVDNLSVLITRLADIVPYFEKFEMIIVDDNSQDGSEELVMGLQKQYDWLRFILRRAKPDLSRSVITGLEAANYDILLVMDADLSHSPQYVVPLIETLRPDVDFVLGSRFIKGGSIAEKWPWFRRCNAQVAKMLTKCLVNLHDPLSGFFCLRRSTFLQAHKLSPIGYKIGLELIVKCRCKSVKEVPIHFEERYAGKSKLSWEQQKKFLRHLARLYQYKYIAAKLESHE